MNTSTRPGFDLCSDHFVIQATNVPSVNTETLDEDPSKFWARLDLAKKLKNNYHLVEIDINDIPNETQAMEIFWDRIRDEEEGDYFEDVEGEIVFITQGDYEGNHVDPYPDDMPITDYL